MRRSARTLSAFILGAVVTSASGARAAASDELTIVSKHTHDGKPSGTSTSYLAADHVRIGREYGNETIVDLKTSVMTTLDGRKKTYFTMTKQDLADMAAKMKARMNTPEMKKAMNAMSGASDAMADSFDVKKTGTSRKVAGFRCDDWTITMGGMTTINECITTEMAYPAHAFEAYKEFSESMRAMTAAFGPMAKAGDAMAQKLKGMKGYPVATSTTMDLMGNKSVMTSEVVEVRHGPIPASAWEIPAGYTKIENPMLRAMEVHGRPHH
jgi:hypothetical protein